MNKLYNLIKSIDVHEAKTGKRISKVSITTNCYEEISTFANQEMEMTDNNFKETGYYASVKGIPFEINDNQKEDFVLVD
jgi:hypothetical protein